MNKLMKELMYTVKMNKVMKQIKQVPMIVYLVIILVILSLIMKTRRREGFKSGITASVYNPISETYYFFENGYNRSNKEVYFYEKEVGKKIKEKKPLKDFGDDAPTDIHIDSVVFKDTSYTRTFPPRKRINQGTYYFFSGDYVYIKDYGDSENFQSRIKSKNDGWVEKNSSTSSTPSNSVTKSTPGGKGGGKGGGKRRGR